MTNRWPEGLAEYALEILPGAERADIEAELERNPEAAEELARTREALAAWAEQGLANGALPSADPRAKRKLFEDLAGVQRFRPLLGSFARCFDLSEPAARELLAKIDDGSIWLPAPVPGGLEYFHFQPGPSIAAAEAGCVRIPPGAKFPLHRHLGPEVTFVLEGTMHDEGRAYLPGSIVRHDADTAHEYLAAGSRPLVIASAHGGIAFVC